MSERYGAHWRLAYNNVRARVAPTEPAEPKCASCGTPMHDPTYGCVFPKPGDSAPLNVVQFRGKRES